MGKSNVKTGLTFLDHMLTSLATHSLIDLNVKATGDLPHHIIEDVALTVGRTLDKALRGRDGIVRFGSADVVMEDALATAAIDLAKRPYYHIELKIKNGNVEGITTQNIEHFLRSFITALDCTCHISIVRGSNDHHKVESAFKALALALRMAVTLDSRRRESPSSKGTMK
jgi:imidazoleglycerol-phosphate dehydratase